MSNEMWYNLAGIVSSVFFVGCLFGLVDQLRKIWRRRQTQANKGMGYATESISANAFFSSFIAFYAFFLYSFMLDEVEFYIFFTRLFAAVMTLFILFEVFRDRAAWSQKLPFLIGISCMALAWCALYFRADVLAVGRQASVVLAMFATLVMLQGGIQQIRKIHKVKTTGVLSLPMNVVFMLKDLANLVFAMVMGLADGWPVMVLASISATLKLVIIGQFYLYRSLHDVADSTSA